MHASCCTAELPYSHHLNAPDCDPNIFRPGEQSVKRNAVLLCVSQIQAAGQTAHSCIRGASIEPCKRFRAIPPRADVRVAPPDKITAQTANPKNAALVRNRVDAKAISPSEPPRTDACAGPGTRVRFP